MPYRSFDRLSGKDLHAVIACIRSLKPIKNDAPPSSIDFPFNLIIRTLPEPQTPHLPPDTLNPIERGRYLANAANCIECHTPQIKGMKIRGMEYVRAGGPSFPGPAYTVPSRWSFCCFSEAIGVSSRSRSGWICATARNSPDGSSALTGPPHPDREVRKSEGHSYSNECTPVREFVADRLRNSALMNGILAGGAFCILFVAGCAHQPQGRIVFQSTRDGNFEIYSMNADGTDQKRLTSSPSNDVNPSWSPDGSHIVFASDRDGNWEIYTMLSDGSKVTRVTRGLGSCTSPSWAGEGTRIVFISTKDAPNGNVYTMNPDGSGTEQLTADSLVKDSPLMTPDGRAVIVTVNLKGRYRIASYRLSDTTLSFLTPSESNGVHPALSPDGRILLFASDRGGSWDIYTMDLQNRVTNRITRDPAGNLLPAWSPAGDEILFTRRGSIYRHTLSNGKEQLLTFRGDSAPSVFLR